MGSQRGDEEHGGEPRRGGGDAAVIFNRERVASIVHQPDQREQRAGGDA